MNETQSPVQDEADGLVYQKLSGNKLAYWSYDPMWLNCGATGERRVDDICRVWLMRIDRGADRNNASFNEDIQQWVTPVEVFEQ